MRAKKGRRHRGVVMAATRSGATNRSGARRKERPAQGGQARRLMGRRDSKFQSATSTRGAPLRESSATIGRSLIGVRVASQGAHLTPPRQGSGAQAGSRRPVGGVCATRTGL